MHTVSFVDWAGELISEQGVLDGESAVAPADPTREGYTFTGWNGDYTNVTSDLTIWATYSVNTYVLTIYYVFENGTTAATTYHGNYTYGSAYSVISPDVAGYTPDIAEVDGVMGAGNVSVTVTYTKNSTVLIGDVDCDGDVDFDDVTLLNAYLLNAAEISEQGLINANVNGDNKISSADVVALNKLILGAN